MKKYAKRKIPMDDFGRSTLEPSDIEQLKEAKKDNSVFLRTGSEKVIKWPKCRKYQTCLDLADKQIPAIINWSCIKCVRILRARVRDLVIFHARRTFNAFELEEIAQFEKAHLIRRISKTDDRR